MLKPERPVTTLFKEIQQGSQPAFDELFLNYYNRLIAFAQQYVKQREYAEEVASELFVKLWLKRKELSHVLNPQVYLFSSIKNASLNQLRAISKHDMISIDDGEVNNSLHLQNNDQQQPFIV